MEGLFFLMSVAGVGFVMWWVLENDAAAPDQPTRGLFALRLGSKLLRKRRGLHGWLATAAGQEAARPPPSRKRGL
jgi:hypothetical protein